MEPFSEKDFGLPNADIVYLSHGVSSKSFSSENVFFVSEKGSQLLVLAPEFVETFTTFDNDFFGLIYIHGEVIHLESLFNFLD